MAQLHSQFWSVAILWASSAQFVWHLPVAACKIIQIELTFWQHGFCFFLSTWFATQQWVMQDGSDSVKG